MWPLSDIARGIAEGLGVADAALREEHSVLGLDARREIDLHPEIADSIGHLGFGVEREVLYPGEHTRAVRKSNRARCDLVLLPERGQRLEDPAHEQAILAASEDTLFAPVAHEIRADRGGDIVAAGDAFWLEIKSTAQHAYVDGVPGPNRAYATQLVKGIMGDAIKLASDAAVWHAGALLLLFAESEEIATHDLAAAGHKLLSEDVPIGSPEITGVPIEDRAGNAWCGVGLFPIRING